tara:strand:- start:40177 stop:41697 length:1521 start_codon:yes stop_codon:yes gene_type:complete
MKKDLLLLIIILMNISIIAQTAPTIEWESSFSSGGNDDCFHILPTQDGGYLAAGHTFTSNMYPDYWLIKLDSSGEMEWEKIIGGSFAESPREIIATPDNGYIIVGRSQSVDGDISGNIGTFDFWVVKINSIGEIQWEKSYGGTQFDEALSIIMTPDNNYVIAGNTASNDVDVTGHQGLVDYWVIKIDGSGNLLWQKTMGGTRDDRAESIKNTPDGGFIVAGYTDSSDGDVSEHLGEDDYWIVKLNAAGEIEWEKTYGGSDVDLARDIQVTIDGNYIVFGYTASNDVDVTDNNGGFDVWVVKLDDTGNIIWQKNFGGSENDYSLSGKATLDGGIVVGGSTHSNNGDVTYNRGSADVWIVKLYASGDLRWESTFGGSNYELSNSIEKTADGGYILGGYSESSDGNVSNPTPALGDIWIAKLEPEVLDITEFTEIGISASPNPVQNSLNVTSKLPIGNIKIYNGSGEFINSYLIKSNNTNIDMSQYSSGVYMLEVENEEHRKTLKIIKE